MGPRFVTSQVFMRNYPSLSIWAAFDPGFDAKHAPHRLKTKLIVTARSTLLYATLSRCAACTLE